MGLRRKTRTLRGWFYGQNAQFEPLEQRRLLSAGPVSSDASLPVAMATEMPTTLFGTGTFSGLTPAITVPTTQNVTANAAQSFAVGSGETESFVVDNLGTSSAGTTLAANGDVVTFSGDTSPVGRPQRHRIDTSGRRPDQSADGLEPGDGL